PSRYADLAREVVSRNPDVIFSVGDNNLTLAFKAATNTIPIVGFLSAPVESGIVTSLARPEGNITGISGTVGLEQWGKRIQLLHRVVPQANRLAWLQSRATHEQWDAFEREVDQQMGITRVVRPLDPPADEAEYRRVFAALVQGGAEGILVNDEEINVAHL